MVRQNLQPPISVMDRFPVPQYGDSAERDQHLFARLPGFRAAQYLPVYHWKNVLNHPKEYHQFEK